ncbi:hypothetical protein LXA43DRAFT_1089285 [Ganoderma leucocontextum]|nr:hypothetical protein LXA43DRAFT_1089285 [Ganoderma leucocontextum]
MHRHHFHRQHHQADSAIGLSQAADDDPQAQSTTATPGFVPSTTDNPIILSSNGPAILPSSSATVLPSAVPTHNVLATSDEQGSVTTNESQGAGPTDDDNDSNNNTSSEPDSGVENEDETDPKTTITPSPTAEDSSTPAAALASDVANTPPTDPSVSLSVSSFVSTSSPPLVIVPAGIPSSASRFLTTNSVTFPTMTPALTPVASSASPSRLASSPRLSSAPFSGSSVSGLLPTGGPAIANLNHPNPAASSQQSERSKKVAALAGFLILGTLGAIGVAVLCTYCGLFRCCRRYKARGFSSTERTAEEGLNDDSQKPVRVNLDEKWSIIPGSPPPTDVEDFVQTLPRDAHTHTLSCSTCPPDSLNGIRSGVPGGVNREAGHLAQGWVFPELHQLAHVPLQPQGESAMHTLPLLAFANHQPDASAGPATPSPTNVAPAEVQVQASVPSSGTPGSTPPDGSAIGEMVSSSGDSYTTCDSVSKYSVASGAEPGRRASGVESIAEQDEQDRPSTPEGSHTPSTMGTPSDLMTPEQSRYGAVDVDVALQMSPSPVRGGWTIARPGEAEGGVGDRVREESEWDVAAAYSYGARGSKGTSVGEVVLQPRPLTPVLGQKGPAQKAKKTVRGRRATGVEFVGKVVGPVALGERKVMVVHG